jgi:hypothetical protein
VGLTFSVWHYFLSSTSAINLLDIPGWTSISSHASPSGARWLRAQFDTLKNFNGQKITY